MRRRGGEADRGAPGSGSPVGRARWLAALRTGLLSRLRSLLFRRAADRDMDEELAFHLQMETEKNLRAGLEPVEARRRALLAFGGVERHRETLRQGRRVPLLEPLWHDLRFGARFLARDPLLALVACVTIALGVGATTAVFSVVNALLLRPLPLPGVERLVTIQETRRGPTSTGLEGVLIPWDRYLAYREATSDVFGSLAAQESRESLSLRLTDVTVAVMGTLTSANWFQTLGVQPVLGRPYLSDDAPEIVISHALWTSRFAADPDALGAAVGLEGATVTVVGVAPPGFGGTTFLASQVWVPARLWSARGGTEPVEVVPLGRLGEGVPLERASARVAAVGAGVPAEPDVTVAGVRVERISGLPFGTQGAVGGFFGLILAMALLVLLIAAANIAGVMLARGFARRKEMAVRLAIGAGRARVVRHLLAESLAVFAAGGLLGTGLAWLGTAWLARVDLPPQVPALFLDLAPDGRVLAFAIALTGLTGVLAGLVPALQASQPDLVTALKTGAASAAGREGRLRDLFVGAQVAVAVTLLLMGTLFARSLRMGLEAELGFEPEGAVAAIVDLGPPLDYDEERARAFTRTLVERVGALPGVERVGLSRLVLAAGSSSSDNVRRPDAPEVADVNASYTLVDAGYFETMGIRVEAGRGFTTGDAKGSPPVVVINRTMADRLFPGESPLGQRIEGFGQEPAEVVGVTAPGKYAFITEQPRAFAFYPYAQVFRSSMALHARAPGAEAATLQAIARELRSLEPDVALGQAGRVEDLIGFSLYPQRFAARLVGAFGVVGLILAALGIYSVLAFQVARRTREIGVRRALGATSSKVVRSVVGRGGRIAAVGCLVGMAAGAGLALVARGFLYGIRPLDPVTFTAVPAVLFLVAVLASWLPAQRAVGVEATVALRTE